MSEPTLFDALQSLPPEHRLGMPKPDRVFCQADATWLEQVNTDGIPADLSTVEYACELLVLLWRERSTWLTLIDELLDGAS